MDTMKQTDTLQEEEMEIDLMEIFHLILQKAWIVILCLALGAGISFGWTKLMITPKYKASSMIYILTKTTSVTSLADIQMGTQLTVDFGVMAESRPVIEEVIERLDLDYTYREVVDMVSTENPANSRILKFTVEHPEPETAKAIANALADATAERVAYVMTTDKPKVVEEAVLPAAPSSPNVAKNTILGGMIGAFLAIGVIVLRYLMNDTIQTSEDMRKYLNLNTLAEIPMETRK